jgi:eukaryotic-like serine/threonine-protein kinase
MLEPGARVLEYEVWGRLGGGGMSDVWLARHVDLAVPVIIKTLKPDLQATPAERAQRMLTEARLMARVPSPYVVRAYDVSTYNDTPFMAQEYVDGLDLNELDHSRRDSLGHGLPLWFVCDAVAQIAHALHAAHQHGVLHRDVKPSNLFGSPELGAKLGDFGIAVAKRIGERAAGDHSGTLRFMPPEALRGEGLDRRADVYELGATAFDLRYGNPPFPDPMVLVSGTPRANFPPPASAEEAQFQYVLARMLAYRPDHRYPTLSEPRRLLHALSKAAQRPPRPGRHDGAVVFCGARITTEAGDIAHVTADAIVNSANWELRMRTGVGDALRRAGGDSIEEEARAQGEQPLGACVVTGPGALGCRYVIHAVSAWEQASCVGRATQRALLFAERLGLRTLALPALGTGAAGVALEACAASMAAALRWHLALGGSRLAGVRLVLYDDERHQTFREVFEAGLLGEEEPVPDCGLPHVAAHIDKDSTSGDAPTIADTGGSH